MNSSSTGWNPLSCCASASDNAACCAKSAKNARQTHYTFRNSEGQTIQLRGDLTMEDLVRMGYTDIRLVMPETPIKPHEWRAESLLNETSPSVDATEKPMP